MVGDLKHKKPRPVRREGVVDVKKVTMSALRYALRLLPYATSGGVKLLCIFTPLDGSAGMMSGRKNVL